MLSLFLLTILIWSSVCGKVHEATPTLHRIPNPSNFGGKNIFPFDQHPNEAKAIAHLGCMGLYEFFNAEDKVAHPNHAEAFEEIFGPANEMMAADIGNKDFDHTAVVGYEQNKLEALVVRELTTFSIAPQYDDDEHDHDPCILTNFNIGSNYFEYDQIVDISLSDFPSLGTFESTYHFKLTFNVLNGQMIESVITSNDNAVNQNLRSVMDIALATSTTIYNAGAYLNLIEKELENDNKNIILIKNVFYGIIVVMVLLTAGIVAFLTKLMLKNCVIRQKQYESVSTKTDME